MMQKQSEKNVLILANGIDSEARVYYWHTPHTMHDREL